MNENQMVLTTDEAREIFFRAIENPPAPNKALKDAVLEHSLLTQNKLAISSHEIVKSTSRSSK